MQQPPIPDPLPLFFAFRHQDPAHGGRVVEAQPPFALPVAPFEICAVRARRIGERVVVAVDNLPAGEGDHRTSVLVHPPRVRQLWRGYHQRASCAVARGSSQRRSGTAANGSGVQEADSWYRGESKSRMRARAIGCILFRGGSPIARGFAEDERKARPAEEVASPHWLGRLRGSWGKHGQV